MKNSSVTNPVSVSARAIINPMDRRGQRGHGSFGLFETLDARLRSATGKRFKRFVLAAVVAVAASQITLTFCLGVFGLPAGVSGFTAWFAGAAASYVMSRWTWERKGRPDLLKETLPFWLIAICVALLLTTTAKLANDFAVSAGFSHTQRILFVDTVYFMANCFTFAARFLIFHFILFKEKRP